MSATSLLVDSALADKPLRQGRLVRIRGRPRQSRNFGQRFVRVQQRQPRFQEVRQARTGYAVAPAAPAAPVVIVEQRAQAPAQAYGSPVVEQRAEEPAQAYGSPAVEQRAEEPAQAYGSPAVEQRAEEPAQAYGSPAVEQRAEEPAQAYGSPAVEERDEAPAQTYGSPVPAPVVEFVAVRAPAQNYGAAPAPAPVAPAAPIPVAQSVRNTYAAATPAANQYQASASSASATRSSAPAAEPIAIVRSVYNAPGTLGYESTYDFDFEAENGIKQSAQGELRTIDDAEVMVMKGSYSYVDENGEDVLVTWYADETGYHAESNILPVAPEIPFEEQRIAVEAQIKFAAEEAANQAASSLVEVSAPAPGQFAQAVIVDARANDAALPNYEASKF